MLHFVCVTIFSNQILDNKQMMISLFVRGSQIERKKKQLNQKHSFSTHNQALKKCETFLNQKQHIETIMSKQSNQFRSEDRIHLNASIDCVRFLLRQGIAFRGHDEFENSSSKKTFVNF